jgi:glutamate---cysteine ligase / carboxylate-amine ligase
MVDGHGSPQAAPDPTLRFGVEEEFLVVDPVSRAVVPRAAEVVTRAALDLGARVSPEITRLQVEVKTLPCTTADELLAQLREGRAKLAAAAAAEGLRVVASGTPVLGRVVPPPMSEGSRPARGIAMYRSLHDESAICAAHVHVELPDRERALLVSNHLRPHLPVLIALMANSPYWVGRDTGYASWRTITWNRWPVAGPPPYFTSVAQFDGLVARLLDAGILLDPGTVFWDVRPSRHQPTLEVRATDVAMTAEESALLAVLVRALVAQAGAAVDRGEPGPPVPTEVMRAAYWLAARDGLDGNGLDVHSGRPVSAVELVQRLVREVSPTLDRHGDLERATGWLGRLMAAGDGAARQRRTAATGRLTDVVDHLIGRTAPSA